MKIKFIWVYLFFFSCLICVTPASALEDETRYSFTPRFWYSISNENEFSNSSTQLTVTEANHMPMGGGSLAISPKGWDSNIVFTFFTGSTENVENTVDTSGFNSRNTNETDRLDLEFLIQNRLGDSPVSVFYGIRYIEYERTKTIVTPGIIFTATGTNQFKVKDTIAVFELGMGVSGNLDADQRHHFFGNFIVFGGRGTREQSGFEDEDILAGGADVNAGYLFSFTDSIKASFRYRFVMFPTTTAATQQGFNQEFTVFHGPEVGLSFYF